MNKSFEVGQSNELVREDGHFDLHNQFDFVGLTIGADRTARLLFRPNPEHGGDNPPVLVEFRDVDYLELSPGFGTRPVLGLDEMGYMSPEQEEDDWLMTESQATNADHLLFRLFCDHVRIHAREARLRTLV